MKNFKLTLAICLLGMVAHGQLSIGWDTASLKTEIIFGRMIYMDSTTAQVVSEPNASIERVTGKVIYHGQGNLPDAQSNDLAVKSMVYYARKRIIPEQWVIKFVQVKTK